MDDEVAMAARGLSTDVTIGIVGAGAMGSGIAQVAAMAGHRVLIFDARAGAAERAVDGIEASLAKLLAKGKITQTVATRHAVIALSTLNDVAECGLVVEAIVEDLAAKRELFRSLEAIVGPTALLASNTSSLSVTSIAAGLRSPERLAGLHFFNPAPVMPLVEVTSGAATSSEVTATLHAAVKQWGKTPVYARSTPGFIVNRVARPFYAEALRVLSEGAADCATIDAIMREAGGFRMGPFELMDFIGQDVNYSVTRSVFEAFYGDRRFTPSLLQLELVEAGFLGRKSGRGFYSYGEGAARIEPQTYGTVSVPKRVRLFGENEIVDRLATTNAVVERIAEHEDGRVAECGSAVLYRCDGRTATSMAAANGVRNTVLLDLSFDAGTVKRISVSAAEQCSAAAMDDAAGLLQSVGVAVSLIGDVPGMLVLRTVAMLANEAADAVNQGVCSTADCDLAMQKGVNYPRGPLAWADEIGLERVVAVLDHMQQAYGEERYRVSPLLRRRAFSGKRIAGER